MTARTNTSKERPRPPRARTRDHPRPFSSLPRPSPAMSDACPEEIDNPSIRASWHLLDARARAFFLQTSPARQIVPAQGSNNAPQPQRHAPVQGGMRPPQGPQYDGDEYLADREDNTSRSVGLPKRRGRIYALILTFFVRFSRTMRIQGTRRSRPPSGSQSPSADPVDSARGP